MFDAHFYILHIWAATLLLIMFATSATTTAEPTLTWFENPGMKENIEETASGPGTNLCPT